MASCVAVPKVRTLLLLERRLAVVTARRAYLTQVQQLHVARAALAEQFHLPREGCVYN